MASIRFNSFIVLVLILLHVRVSSAQTTALGKGKSYQDIYDGVPDTAEFGNTRLGVGGRKMIFRREIKMVREEGLEGENSKISAAVNSAGNCDLHRGKENLNVNCKLSKRGVKLEGFIAFNADYHVPRPHPPKNN